MIFFPYAKINLGLFITSKREDGFHNLESLFIPVNYCDILEICPVENEPNGSCFLRTTGLEVACPIEKNLVHRAYRLLSSDFCLPSVQINLHKIIPSGAGLGGGSSDGAMTLMGLNRMFRLNLSEEQLIDYAASLGSDCPFFIKIGLTPEADCVCFATGRGERLELLHGFEFPSKEYSLAIVKPDISISTAEAYAVCTPHAAPVDLRTLRINETNEAFKVVYNDFETIIENHFPECHAAIAKLKNILYEEGALYASMSGSGSALFALFPKSTTHSALSQRFGHHLLYFR